MIFVKQPSFARSWKRLTPARRARAEDALARLVLFFEGGSRPEGLGLKKLKHFFWEIRTDLKDRILFRIQQGRVEFILIGNHNEIHRMLKR